MKIIALEGPSHAGKSTLLAEIDKSLQSNDICYLPDYVDVAGGPLIVPSTPGTSLDEIQGLLFFLQVEQVRLGAVQQQEPLPSVCFLDRSLHTLLAHRYALEQLKSIKCFELSSRITSELTPNFYPDEVFYLDTPEKLLVQRREERIAKASAEIAPALEKLIFDTGIYISCFRRYFDQTFANSHHFHVLDGENDTQTLAQSVISRLKI